MPPRPTDGTAAEQEQAPLLSSSSSSSRPRPLTPITEQWVLEDTAFYPWGSAHVRPPLHPHHPVRSTTPSTIASTIASTIPSPPSRSAAAPAPAPVRAQAQGPTPQAVTESSTRHHRHRSQRMTLSLNLPVGLVREDGTVDADVLANLNAHIGAANPRTDPWPMADIAATRRARITLGGALRAVIWAPIDVIVNLFGIPPGLDEPQRIILWLIRFFGIMLVTIVYINCASYSWALPKRC